MNRKIIASIMILIMVAAVTLSGCEMSTSTNTERKYTEQNMQEMNRQIGMPNIDNYFEKRMAKEIFELRDDSKLITYAYIVNLDGKFVYLGRAIGFGLPYSTQYTNPEIYTREGGTIPQADPNGLYMPAGLSATWVMLIHEETGDSEIIYTEPAIVITQSPLPKRLVASWSLPKNYDE